MADLFSNNPNQTLPGSRHFTITPSDTVDMAIQPRALFVTVAGNLALQDKFGTNVTYAVTVGIIIPFRATRVLATGTTATVVGWD